MTTEIWKDVDGFDLYEVSNLGRVRRKAYVLSPGSIPSGHLTVALCKGKGKPKSMYVHRLVALAFLENPDCFPVINHKNGNPKDNNLKNLEWTTQGENIKHGYRSNGRKCIKDQKVAGIDIETGEIKFIFESGAKAARYFNVETSAIWSAVRRNGTSCGYKWVRYVNS